MTARVPAAVHDTLAVLDTDDALTALRPEWEALWRRVPGATPFSSPWWAAPWWRQFGTGQPRVACLHRGGRLAGVLPLYVLDEDGGRKLLPIGAGTTDYLDALVEPGLDPAPLLAAALDRAGRDGVAVCDLIEVPADGALLGRPAPPGWRGAWREAGPCPVLALPASVDAMAETVPHAMRRALRLNRNRAARAGGWHVETATAPTFPALMAELVRLHQARWTAAGEPGTLADPRVLAFHADAAPMLLEAGLLRLQVLRLGDAVAAAVLALLGPGRILFYLSGYDAARAYESPGTLLVGAMLEEAVREGRREAHFLRGSEAYKYAWGAVDRPNHTCRLIPA